MYWSFLVGAIILAIGGQGLLKAGADAASFQQQLFATKTIAGLFIYGLSSILYIVALRRIPLSVALPCTAISYVFVTALGYFVFHEPVGTQRLVGLGCISIGVVVLATS